MNYINGNDLYQMFNYGTVNIVNKREKLNELNVFPVPDSDTGNNLASTMQAITQKSVKDESFHESLVSISESALFGAKGNSGVIFAQFVNGLRYASNGKSRVTMQEFSNMVLSSVDFTYSALSNPVEGTMLTVIKDWAHSLISVVKKEVTVVKDVFEIALVVAKKSLEDTKKTLKVLEINNVVDSGAMGFVLFLQGIESYYNNEVIQSFAIYEDIILENTHKHDEFVKFRYCTEGLVKFTGEFNESELKSKLEPYGDSLIVAKGVDIFKVHIHTNEPTQIFNELRHYGKILTQKVDNMKLDIAFENSKRRQVIVTDSSADIPIELLNSNHIAVIPLNVILDGVNYYDKVSLDIKVLFEMLPTTLEYPTTSTPSIKYIKDTYQKLVNNFDDIIVLTITGEQSGTYDVFKKVAKEYNKNGKRIEVIDTYGNSVSEGLLVKKASEMVIAGKSTDEIIEYIKETRKEIKIYLCLATLDNVIKSGRISKTAGTIGNIVGMRPIVSMDETGKGITLGVAFSQKGIMKKIAKIMQSEMDALGIDSYAIVHCLNEELANEYKEIFTEMVGKEPEYVVDSSCAGGIHTGMGTVGIGYIKNTH